MEQHNVYAAQRIRGLAAQLRSVAESLRGDDATFARGAERASQGIERLAGYVGSPRARRLVRVAERLAQRRPAVFAGTAFLLGLAVVRFLKSPGNGQGASSDTRAMDALDESQMPRRDRPSGYFSARGEGASTNTPGSRETLSAMAWGMQSRPR